MKNSPSSIELEGLFFFVKKKSSEVTAFYYGGDKGIRTPGLLNAIQARSQLRHTPTE